MKRTFQQLTAVALMAALTSGSLFAQDLQTTAPAGKPNNVTIVQKTKNEDGTVTIKKTSIAKGENIENIWNVVNLEDGANGIQEVTVLTGDAVVNTTEDAETVIFIREGKNMTEVKWDDSDGLTHGLNDAKPFFEKQQLALIGDAFEDEQRPLLGIYPGDGEGKGVLVDDIVPGGGAEAAGMLAGDLITNIDGTDILNKDDLHNVIGSHKAGDEVTVVFMRNGQNITTTSELKANKPNRHAYRFYYNSDFERNPCEVFIGVQLGTWDDGERGVGVSGIISGWPAEEAGLQAGDRVVSIDGIEVNTHGELVVERDKHKPGDYFTIGYLRNGKVTEVKARFKVCPTDQPQEEVQEVPQVTEQVPVQPSDNALQLEEFNAYPNPTAGNLNVTFRGEAVPTVITVTDITGKVLHRENLPNFDGYYNKQLDVSAGTPGTLMLTVIQNDKVQTKPILLLNKA